MSTPHATPSSNTAKRKGSFSSKAPGKTDRKKAKGELKERSASRAELSGSETVKPEHVNEPALSARKSGTASTASTASTTTSTTTTTSTSTTTTNGTGKAKATANGGASNTNGARTADNAAQRAEEETWGAVDMPRESWLHYNTGNETDTRAAIAARGARRRVELRAMGEAFKGSAPELLFRGMRKPTHWLKQFCAEAAPVWSEVLEAIQLESENPEIQRACAAPAKNMERLEQAFSRILKSWAGKGQGHVNASLSLAAKAMCAEMTYAYKMACSEAGKGRDPAIMTRLIVDLLVCSLVEAKDAPAPLSAMFGNYLAAFLENEPMQPDLFDLDDAELTTRLNFWSAAERVGYSDFDPKAVFLAYTATPLQKFELPTSSEKFLEQSRLPLAKLENFKSMRGMGSEGDPGLIGPLKREFEGSGSWHQVEAGQLVDITHDPEAMKRLFNKYPLQAALAQFCCTQSFHQTGLAILLGGVKEKTPFKDLIGRPVAPKLSACVPKWTIERKNDDALEVTCVLTTYREQVDLVVRDADSEDPQLVASRLLLPGWYEMIFKVSIDPYAQLRVEQLSCSAYNLHLLEGMPETSRLPAPEEEAAKPEAKSALRSLKRLSQKFIAPLNFDKDKEDEVPPSPRSESAAKADSPTKKPKAREKEKD